ncbi:hypothetical protein SOVF_209650, partial [Spinacia oleracea]
FVFSLLCRRRRFFTTGDRSPPPPLISTLFQIRLLQVIVATLFCLFWASCFVDDGCCSLDAATAVPGVKLISSSLVAAAVARSLLMVALC